MRDYTNATPEERTHALEALGLTISSTFVPLSESRNAGKWRSLNWEITLRKDRKKLLRTDYAQGEAHCPAYRDFAKGARRTCVDVDNAIRYECEHGRSSWKYSEAPIPGPPLLEVCHALAMDAQSGQESFAEFCASFGYDEDSRKAEATWRAYANVYRAFGATLTEAMGKIVEGY